MALYSINVDGVALVGATAKTLIEIPTPSTRRALIKEWWVDFDGVTAGNTPVKVEVQRFDIAATTMTILAGNPLQGDPVALVLSRHTASTEGAGVPTAASGWIKRIPPTSGFHYIAVEGRELILPVSAFFRIRLTAAQAVNATCGVIWGE